MRDIEKQIQQDIDTYGADKFFLLWEYEYLGKWITCTAAAYVTPQARRKESAALPFDLKRAKAGDAVEWRYATGEWKLMCGTVFRSAFIVNDRLVTDHVVHRLQDLRMKYPQNKETTNA